SGEKVKKRVKVPAKVAFFRVSASIPGITTSSIFKPYAIRFMQQPLFPILVFAFVASITPGPNNTLVMTTAANWGFRASLPVFFGVVSGFLLMVFAVGAGLGGIFTMWPALHTVLKWV